MDKHKVIKDIFEKRLHEDAYKTLLQGIYKNINIEFNNKGWLIWHNGTWKDGAWYDGIWKGGTWEDGTWKDGVWKDGVWKDGIWKGGIWYNGAWYDGKWEYGFWKYGTWYDGVWEDGAWKGGKIWHKEKEKYIVSNKNPNECEWSLSFGQA